ncbi:MAG: PAS domain S-box protein, partial [Gemmatimonadales bacterium]
MCSPPTRIFIVEDEALISMELKDRLERLGYEPCGTAARGEEALIRIREETPDLVLMDVHLAGELDGIQAAMLLGSSMHLPVVFLTAFSDDETVQRILESHPFGYVVKPFDERELHIAIQVALSKHRKERELQDATARLEVEVETREGELAETREQLAFLLSRSPTVLYSRRPGFGGPLAYVSPNVREVLGLEPAELLGGVEGWEERIHPEDRERVLEALECDEASLQIEYRIRNGAENWRWINDALARVASEGGDTQETVGSWVDVTDRKVAELELRALNARLDAEVEARTRDLRESEGFRRATLDSLSAHVAVLDEEGIITATNQAWRDFARDNGADPDAVGEGVSYLGVCELAPAAPEDAAPSLGQGIREVLAGRRDTFEMEYPCHGPHTRNWFLGRVKRFRYGGRSLVLVSHENVTPVHEALSTLHESRETLAALAQASPVGIFWADVRGRFLEVNDRWCAIAGIPADAALEEGWLAAVHPEDRAGVRRAWRQAVRNGRSIRSEFRFLHPDGECSWVIAESVDIRDPSGAVSGHIGVVTDISDRKQVEEALRALSTELAFVRRPKYFAEVSRTLARLLDVEVAFIGEWRPRRPDQMTVLAWAEGDDVREGFSFDIDGLPCREALCQDGLVIPERLGEQWPETDWVDDRELEAYAAVPLRSPAGEVVGLVAVASRIPFRNPGHVRRILELFAVSASGELARRTEERRFDDLLNLAPDAILMTDARGTIIMANQRTEEIFGWRLGELEGKSVEALLPPEFREVHQAHRSGYVGSGKSRLMGSHRGDLRGLARDGRQFPVEVGLAGVETEEGAVIAIIRDVTERKRAQEELSTARSHLNDALDSIDEGVILWDPEDRIAITNRRALEFHPVLAEVLVPGTGFSEVVETALDRGVLTLPDGMDRADFLEMERTRHLRADGEEIRVRLPENRIWSFAHLPSHRGGRVTVLTDQTEKVRIEEQFRRAQKIEALGKLTGGLAHDFNNYLGVIFGYLELLREEVDLPPRAREYLDSALTGADRGAQLTRSLLSFARKQPLQPRISNVGQTVSETIHLLRRT